MLSPEATTPAPDGRPSVAGPLVSVVIPSYDRPAFVRRAVESVLQQTYSSIELIVVDDHSPEPVKPLLADLPVGRLERFRVIRHEENRGGNAARNTGIEAAQGEYVAFLDDDDRWLPEKIERQVEAFDRAAPDVGVVYTGAATVDGNDEVVSTFVREARGDLTRRLLGDLTIGSFSRVMVRRSAIEAAGLPDERFPNWQDREWYLRLSEHCAFEPVPEPLTVHTNSGHGQITDDFEGKRDVALPLFLEKHRSTAAQYGWAAERRFVSVLLWSVGWTGFTSGNRRGALSYLLRSLAAWPFATRAYLLLTLAILGPRVWWALRRAKAERTVRPTTDDPDAFTERLPTLSPSTRTDGGEDAVR